MKCLTALILSMAAITAHADEALLKNRLAAKIRAGGSGVWGTMPMPANAQVSEADAKKMAAWILNVK